ncbi:PEP-CTERM sorting domain-containing protein [bacterium]|nr:PEP-CTERM sorting domain-containing protein [bacterium]
MAQGKPQANASGGAVGRTPKPGTMTLLALGGLGALARRRRRRK